MLLSTDLTPERRDAAFAEFESCIEQPPPDEGDFSPRALNRCSLVTSYFAAMKDLVCDPKHGQVASARFMCHWPPGFAWVRYMRNGMKDTLNTFGLEEASGRMICATGLCLFAHASAACKETRETYMNSSVVVHFFIDTWATKNTDREMVRHAADALNVIIRIKKEKGMAAFVDTLNERFRSSRDLALLAISRARTALLDFIDMSEACVHLPVLEAMAQVRGAQTAFDVHVVHEEIVAFALGVIPSLHTHPKLQQRESSSPASICVGILLSILTRRAFVEKAFRLGLVEPLARIERVFNVLDKRGQQSLAGAFERRICTNMHHSLVLYSARHDFASFAKKNLRFEAATASATYKSLWGAIETNVLLHAVLRCIHDRGIGRVEEYCSRVSIW